MVTPEKTWKRDNTFRAEVLLLDGLTGAGKTMVMRALDAFPNLAPPKFNYQFEHLCIALTESKSDDLSGIQILELLIDQLLYDQKIAREINLRPKDLSSIFKSQKRLLYLSRLMKRDGENASDRIELENERLFLVVHQLLDRAKIVERLSKKTTHHVVCFRHPYYLIDHWASYIDMHGTSPRDFTMMDGNVPWFIYDREEFLLGDSYQRAAFAISTLNNRALRHVKDPMIETLAVNFEEFVLSPKRFLEQFSSLLGEEIPRNLGRVLGRELVPRTHINNTKRRGIYKRYGADLLDSSMSHSQDYYNLENRMRIKLGDRYFSILREAAVEYEEHFGKWF